MPAWGESSGAGPVLSPVRDAEIFYRFSLRAPWGHLAVSGILLFVLWFLAPKVWRHMTTESLSANPTLENLIRATHLEPDRAEYPNLLGQYYLRSTESYDPEKAIQSFRQATRLNPSVAAYWMNLARAYEAQGRGKEAGQTVETALINDPLNPALGWISGNTKMMAGDLPSGLEAWRDSIIGDPSNAHVAYDRGWRLTQNTQLLLDHLVPPDNEYDLKFLDFLSRREEREGSADPTLVWKRIASRGQSLDPKLTESYMTWLLKPRTDSGEWRQRVQTAKQVWPEILRLGLGVDDKSRPLITNGGFEQELLGLGFDWRWVDTPNVSLVLDRTVFFEGHRSLRVDFNDAPNSAFVYLRQYLPVDPGHRYQVTAQIRADRMSGGAPRLAVRHPLQGNVLVEGKELTQTRDFVEERLEFVAPRDLPLVYLDLWRPNSRLLHAKVKGTYWLDDVAMADLGSIAGNPR